MSLRIKSPKGRNYKYALTSGAVVVGAAFLILKTFPHLQTSIVNFFCDGNSSTKETTTEENEPIELENEEESDYENDDFEDNSLNSSQYPDESIVKIEKWSEDNLRSWLSEKDVTPPTNTSHNNLVALVNSIKESS